MKSGRADWRLSSAAALRACLIVVGARRGEQLLLLRIAAHPSRPGGGVLCVAGGAAQPWCLGGLVLLSVATA